MIKFENVTKAYPDGTVAVDGLNRKAFDAGLSLPAAVQDRDLRPDVDAASHLAMLPEFGN
jgi:hypothetical protein